MAAEDPARRQPTRMLALKSSQSSATFGGKGILPIRELAANKESSRLINLKPSERTPA